MQDSTEKNLQISTAQHDAQNIIVRLKDSGSGFDAEAKDDLFEPFFTTKKEGMGMGLPIARTIVKTLQGSIWVENNEGGGASVFITLPICETCQA